MDFLKGPDADGADFAGRSDSREHGAVPGCREDRATEAGRYDPLSRLCQRVGKEAEESEALACAERLDAEIVEQSTRRAGDSLS